MSGLAEPVTTAEHQLSGLLRATRDASAGPDLPAVLQRLVNSAGELIGAKHVALHVRYDDSGDEASFVAGRPEMHVPDGSPAARNELRLPVRIHDLSFGTLEFCNPTTAAQFGAADEVLAAGLALTAAGAIEHARLTEAARAGERSALASAAIIRSLLIGEDDPRTMILQRALTSLGAATTVLDLATDGAFRVDAAVGVGADKLVGISFSTAHSLSQRAIDRNEPLLFDLGRDVPDMPNPFEFGPVLVVPMIHQDGVRGTLMAARPRGAEPFDGNETLAAEGFADHLALALSLDEAQAGRIRVDVLEERARISRDLHDTVIQRLFATGMGLEQLARGLPPDAAARLEPHITGIDDTIRALRQTIFALTNPDDTVPLRTLVLDVLDQAAPLLGFPASLQIGPGVAAVTDGQVVSDVVASVREAVSNVVRHAQAGSVQISLRLYPSPDFARELVLQVSDDGKGIDEATTRRSGLANLHQRAARHGGGLTLDRTPGGGLRLIWRIPVSVPAADHAEGVAL